ncbi:sulfotransferase [Leisingera sp. McT4-56]|uniref:sulfotransferase n=1 Tax=Leisingera sp. McT4-56 TaxID=2881255 RepID=UPI001CF81F70|nr:sulfotransferase [Leisingera sp. McT4-56]MCB4457205.1 sulfotransferase [Leisingera sp. McT4-56]
MSGLVPHQPLKQAPETDLERQLALTAAAAQRDAALAGRLQSSAELPELLAEGEELAGRPQPPLLRTVHHFACTGGTLISRCIAAMPCTRLLSEVDPLSTMTHRNSFLPADLIGLAKLGSSPPEQETLLRIFRAGLAALEMDTRAEGRDLILRDHAHSHFCCGSAIPERPSLRQILEQGGYRLQSLVTVRHPLDSYLSLLRQNWVHWQPAALEEYARRYLAFLDHYAGAELLRYEDFVAEPQARMTQICKILGLAFNPDFQDDFAAIALSGDSGRRGEAIEPRPRRPVPEELAQEAGASSAYASLCGRLGYDPEPGRESA